MLRSSPLRRFLPALVILAAGTVQGHADAIDCQRIEFEGDRYSVCQVDASQQEIRLFLNDDRKDRPFGSFDNVAEQLHAEGKVLRFGMNAGMYHQDRSPVGLYVENGKQIAPLITRDGPGNFGLLPNGVFCIRETRADVIETLRFQREAPECRFATQSGPMLVIDSELHPRFLPKSDSRYIRNGVGTDKDGRNIWFAISEAPVTFHAFGRLFRDVLRLPQALYFDGNISKLFAPGLGRHDGGLPMGPIVGVVGDGS
ncbi:phosphodiester glycosidase family protein [Roseovarius aestuariivivens]|uniref:phosphodiester glycosidase family protein n=1 Tax=Roseovarius aestuariivivens TaxID=1888910 RepID=UPI00107FDD16|nr:phosphodiester glycosidase family protein [Roseovarius aestuariivivens]